MKNKTKTKAWVGVRMPAHLKEELIAIGESEDRTLAQMVRLAITEYLERRKVAA